MSDKRQSIARKAFVYILMDVCYSASNKFESAYQERIFHEHFDFLYKNRIVTIGY